MRYGGRRLVVVVAAVTLIVAGAAVGAYLLTRDTGPRSPAVLNEPTDARRPRALRPGPQPGFPLSRLKREQHDQ